MHSSVTLSLAAPANTRDIDLNLNEEGIRRDSGIMAVPEPFSLNLNRPFLFLIHEHETGSLLYPGAITDPTQN